MADEYGAHLRRLTDHPADDENPAWSPAWTRVAFQSKRNGNWDLYSLRAECAPPRSECDLQPLTDHPADDLLPAWSPDGRRIAFVSLRDGNDEIYLMDQDGRNQRRLTFHSGGDWRPAWLPDSQHLVFTSDRSGNNDLYQLAVPATDAPPPTGEADLTTLVSSPADERDPAVGVSSMLANYFDQPELLFFLSDQAGGWKTFVTSLDGRALPVQPFAEFDQPQAHPSWLKGYTLLVAVGEGADSDIDALTPFGASSPLIVSPGFDGHPAGGPVWWQPVAESDQAPLSPP